MTNEERYTRLTQDPVQNLSAVEWADAYRIARDAEEDAELRLNDDGWDMDAIADLKWAQGRLTELFSTGGAK